MRRLAIVSICGLVAALLAMYLPVAAFLPSIAPIAFAGGERIPASNVTHVNGITPVPEFVRTQVINVTYRASGTAGGSGVFWTLLYWRIPGSMDWTLYQPPWNPEGRWFGQLGFSTDELNGTIPFNTFYAGGEATYEFYTVAVDRGYKEEGPADRAKARTTLDTHPPNLFIDKPSPRAWTKNDTLTWSATDAVSGLEAIEAVLDTRDPMSFAVEIGRKDANGSQDLSLQLEDEGDHDLVVRAWDRARNEAVVFVPFHFDPNAPTLAIRAPERGRYLNRTDVEVRWDAGDSASGIASLQVTLDGRLAADLAGDVRRYTLKGLSEAQHAVMITAFDAVGNFAAESVTFEVDVTAPSLRLIRPVPDTFSNEQDLHVLWIGTDAGSGIRHFLVSHVEAGKTSPPISDTAMFTFEQIAQGPNTVRVVAVDWADNRAEASARVTVDYTRPSVSITSPSAGAEVTGDLSIAFTATDAVSGIGRVELVYDGVMTPLTDATSPYRITDPRDGAHIAFVRAWDKAGNFAETFVSFRYGASGPIEPSNLPALEFWLLIFLISAIAVGSAYYAVRRRNRSKA